MSDSIFGDLDIANASDDPFKVEDGTYDAVVVTSEIKDTKSGDKKGWSLKYKIESDDAMNGRTPSEWRNVPRSKDEENYETDRSFIKQRMTAFGVPEDRMNSFQSADALGALVTITVKNNEKDGVNYTNVTKVVARSTGSAAGSNGSGNAFAGL